MPTYDYVCEQCEHEFEVFQSITADPLKECPECKGKVKRLIGGGSGVLFKGSGFYETDYRSKSYQDAAKKDSEKSKPTEKSSAKAKKKSKPKKSPSNE